MKWEDLEVYRPLKKEDLKPAFKDFIKIISENLKHFGFELKGRKIQRIVNDVIQTIHIDTRGSWTGINENYKIEISVSPYCNCVFIDGELVGVKRVEEIIPKIRNHYRVTQEYMLLADFITRQIIDKVLDYFDRFNSTLKIVKDIGQFSTTSISQRNEAVVIFSELRNQRNKYAEIEINKILKHWNNHSVITTGYLSQYLIELKFFAQKLTDGDWESIDRKLMEDEDRVLKKLKLKISTEP